MKVVSSSLSMAASRQYSRHEEQGSRVETWVTAPPRTDRVELRDSDERTARDARLAALIAIVEQLTGREVEVLDPAELERGGTARAARAERPAAARGGWGVSIDAWHRVEEQEDTRVAIRATVTDADGVTHDVALDLRMSRRFVEEQRLSIRAGTAPVKDPLIVTLDGGVASFGADTRRFDLDLDGSPDRVRLTAGSSGFLVHDLDGDGAITDGRELFGPTTGNGFVELARLDDDGNGWIDESDEAYTRLGWAGADGAVRSLADVGIGAIATRAVTSPFLLTEPDGRTPIGEVRATGLARRDDGGAASVQQVDLAL